MIAPDAAQSPKPRLLIVDDETENVELVRRVFRSDFELYFAKDGEEGLAVARRVRPDVIITDQRMPNVTGVQFLKAVCEEMPDTVRVLVTAFSDYNAVVGAINSAHVHHYVEKPLHALDLATVVRSLLHARNLERDRARLIERLEAKEAQLERLVQQRTEALSRAHEELEAAKDLVHKLAVRDRLTGLYNYRYLLEFLGLELQRAQRFSRNLAILFIDIDDLRRVNDAAGYGAGDEVLARIADVLQPSSSKLHTPEFAARHGGEEFCLVLPEAGLRSGATEAERIRHAVERLPWGTLGATTVSIGVAAFPESGVDVDTLLQRAEDAAREAKSQGKNRVVVAGGG